jgi:hypothetical protein
MSQTQFSTFQNWYNNGVLPSPPPPTYTTASDPDSWTSVKQHYQIRAQQLRKTAGALEQFYATVNDEKLSPTFNKNAWQPPQTGYFQYVHRDDHLPMIAMGQVKAYLKERLQRQDDAVFQMNHLRNLIEKTEDKAENALDAPSAIADLISKINGYFALPQYSAVLVKDQSDVYPTGSTTPRYRVHELDPPTTFEQEQHGRVLPGDPVDLKEGTQPVS